MKYAVPVRNPKTGEKRIVVVELEPAQEAVARRAPGSVYGPRARGYALQNAVSVAGGCFFFDDDIELVH